MSAKGLPGTALSQKICRTWGVGAALQVSLGDSGVINLTCFPLLSVPVTAQNGFFP